MTTDDRAAQRWRKKPVVVDAFCLGPDPIPEWFRVKDIRGDSIYIDTLEGVMEARTGDWIIRGVKGEVYPCKPDIFAATYEPADAAPPAPAAEPAGGYHGQAITVVGSPPASGAAYVLGGEADMPAAQPAGRDDALRLLAHIYDNLNDMPISEEWAAKMVAQIDPMIRARWPRPGDEP